MPKTYGTVTTFTAGSVLTAAQLNVAGGAVNNLVVPAAARIRLTSNYASTNSTHTLLGFTSTNATKDYDTDSMITLSASASSITINTPGIYVCTASIDYTASSVGVRYVRAVRNRAGTKTGIAASMYVPTASDAHACISGMIECAANDVIELYGFQTSGGSLNILAADASGIEYGGTWMSVAWIGRTS